MTTTDLQAQRKSWFERHAAETFLILGLVCLLLAELLLQIHHYVRHKEFVFNKAFEVTNIERTGDERGYRPRKNYATFRYHINKETYRGDLVQGDPDLLALGDSVPFGSGVADHQTYAAFLSKDFGLKVINGGVPSYTFWQSLERWKEDFKHVQPKVVTFQSTNDVPLATHFQGKWYPKITWLNFRWTRDETLTDHPLRKSALYHYVSQALSPRNEFGAREQHKPLSKEQEQAFFEHISRSFDEIAQYGLETQTPVVLISGNLFWYTDDMEKNKALPFWTKDIFEPFQFTFRLYQIINKIMEQKAAEYDHVYYFNVVSMMDQMDRSKLFRDPVHHTPYGNRVFAELLHAFLRDNGLLP